MPSISADDARISRWREDLGPATATSWWLVEEGGAPQGFVGIGPSRDPIDPELGELDTIAVQPGNWRRGYGTALMNKALKELAAANFRLGILWTLSDYPLGESFYLAHGWRLNGAMRNGGDQVRYDHDLQIQHPD
jgi:GNAT superfamily N-acetyltransferase